MTDMLVKLYDLPDRDHRLPKDAAVRRALAPERPAVISWVHRAFGAGWFWLWEGVALHAETMGDAPGTDSQEARIRRFRTRLERGETTPLTELVGLRQTAFRGRHYDQTAALMRYLLDPARPTMQRNVYRLVARLMRGPLPAAELERTLGRSLPQLERAWLDSLPR